MLVSDSSLESPAGFIMFYCYEMQFFFHVFFVTSLDMQKLDVHVVQSLPFRKRRKFIALERFFFFDRASQLVGS